MSATSPSKVLVIDDDKDLRYSLRRALAGLGYNVIEADSGESGVGLAKREQPDVILLDNRMGGMSGIETLQMLRGAQPQAMVILMTAYGTTQTAIEAMKFGAFDYVMKPFDQAKLIALVDKAMSAGRDLANAGKQARMLVNPADYKEGIIGSSEPMQEVLKSIGQVAASDATVLITGESGTGKELVARCIHQHSLRSKGPFTAVNCAAIPENLIESELFGHEKGAFTGAAGQKPGKFELCDGGTIFLDEIGDMSLPTQTKVLRAIQEGEIQRVGGTATLKVSVRVVAATNKDLETMVAARQFREDLYYRLNVFRIRLPALRERKGDVPLLVDYMLQRQAAARKSRPKRLSAEALEAMLAYDWPGNVRELENVVQRANVLAKGETILTKDLPSDVLTPRRPAPAAAATPAATSVAAPAPETGLVPSYDAIYRGCREGDGKSILNVIEMEMIKRAMEETRGNQLRAALILGINRSTLKKRLGEMREAGIRVFT
ncbi:MAG: sigma-54-dependent Fis family transcriptional regulator [Verrucomicrobia bacterium]|nr:sigma-54-dependent Fis family transcriptional regulator [Verrucomicrobiota bacterium]